MEYIDYHREYRYFKKWQQKVVQISQLWSSIIYYDRNVKLKNPNKTEKINLVCKPFTIY